MSELVVENLILLEWLAKGHRSYPRDHGSVAHLLPGVGDAMDRGLIFLDAVQGVNVVRATPAGLALLEQHRPSKI